MEYIYDSQSCKSKFYDGHLDHDFDVQFSEPTGATIGDYMAYIKQFDDVLTIKPNTRILEEGLRLSGEHTQEKLYGELAKIKCLNKKKKQ